MWEIEKLLVTSNFSFSHSVFKRLVLQTRKNQGLFGKGLRNDDCHSDKIHTYYCVHLNESADSALESGLFSPGKEKNQTHTKIGSCQ